jgi:dihydrolipoamide dehydrogenase
VARTETVRVPDIGDFENVEVIEVLVSPGDRVEVEQSLIAIESEKASMEVPSPLAGVVRELLVAVGDTVSEGDPIAKLEIEAEASAGAGRESEDEEKPARERARAEEEAAAAPERRAGEREDDDEEAAREPEDEEEEELERRAGAQEAEEEELAQPREPQGEAEQTPRRRRGEEDRHEKRSQAAPKPGAGRADLVVLGSGPGGYTAAFRAADLGLRVVLVEPHEELGGVCLNVGCIPSKALLHVAAVIEEARALEAAGVSLGAPRVDLEKLRAHKDRIVGTLTGGLAKLAAQRGVEVVRGRGRFTGAHELAVEGEGARRLGFAHAVVAVGSTSVGLPDLPDDPRIMDSTAALALPEVPGRLLVIGGGVIGLEMATVYQALGSRVTIVELLDRLMAEADPDLVRPLEKRLRARSEAIFLETRVRGAEASGDGIRVRLEGKDVPEDPLVFDRVLVAVGRRASGDRIDAERAGVHVSERGVIPVDGRLRTNVSHVYAIGDVTGPPLLAHRATHQGKVAAEVIAGRRVAFDARAVPSVAYTDPEVAWTGLTEAQAQAEGIAVRKAVFPWSASGRALGSGRGEGATKLLFSADHGRLLGAGIVGPHAGELISEATLALELGADAEDMALTIHPHPTLSETLAFAAELAAGTITDLLPPRKR